jgi:GNAT superfamily N-acetyltransferase
MMSEILTDLSTPALLNAVQANAYAFFLRRERILGKTACEEKALTWLEAHSSPPVAWLHGWIHTRDVPARAAEVAGRCAARGLSEAYLVAFEMGQHRAAWQAAGATQIETEHILVTSLSGAGSARPLPQGLAIEHVADDAGLQDCAAVISAGRDQWTAGFFQLTNPSITASQESMRFYLARLAGRPVATAAQFFWGGLAGIWWVTTIPDFRRRGISTTITRAVLSDAAHLGYHAAMVEASPDAAPMYRRLGFPEFGLINVYRRKNIKESPGN